MVPTDSLTLGQCSLDYSLAVGHDDSALRAPEADDGDPFDTESLLHGSWLKQRQFMLVETMHYFLAFFVPIFKFKTELSCLSSLICSTSISGS